MVDSKLPLDLGGLRFGVTDSAGVQWHWRSLTGWWSAAAVDAQVEPYATADGGVAAGRFPMRPRQMTLVGAVRCPTPDLFSDAMDRVSVAVGDAMEARTPLVVWETSPKQTSVRASSLDLDPVDDQAFTFAATLIAEDPRKYSLELTDLSTGLPAAGRVRRYPRRYPLRYEESATAVARGSVEVVNRGTVSAPVESRVGGPLPAGWRVENTTSGLGLTVNRALTASEGAVVDHAGHTVLIGARRDVMAGPRLVAADA